MKALFALIVLSTLSLAAMAQEVEYRSPQFECTQSSGPTATFQFRSGDTIHWKNEIWSKEDYGFLRTAPFELPASGPTVFEMRTQFDMKTKKITVSSELLSGARNTDTLTLSSDELGQSVVTATYQCSRVITSPIRPDSIKCTVEKPEGILPKEFALTHLNTNEPDSDIDDAGLMDPLNEFEVRATGYVHLSFSNECDNMYEVQLAVEDLVRLREKKVTSIFGHLEGSNSDAEQRDDGTMPVTMSALSCVLN